jgi:hypothetical protein
VAGDVDAGDRVVVEGVQRLRDGATVAILDDQSRPGVLLTHQGETETETETEASAVIGEATRTPVPRARPHRARN